MMVRVRLFAAARELAGQDELAIELPAGATIARLRQALAEHAPPLAGLLRHVWFAIGTDYADDEQPLADGLEVACIPPVSGG